MGDDLEELQRALHSQTEVTSAAVGDGIERPSTRRRQVVRQIKSARKGNAKAVKNAAGRKRAARPKSLWPEDDDGNPIRPGAQDIVGDLQQIGLENPSIKVGPAMEKLGEKWGYRGKTHSLADLVRRKTGASPGTILSRGDVEEPAHGSREVVSRALAGCALLEMAVYRYARRAFSEETFAYLKELRGFGDCLNAIIAIVREAERIREADIVPLLEKAHDIHKDRNKITRDTSNRGELALELINDLAVAANTLSERITESVAALG